MIVSSIFLLLRKMATLSGDMQLEKDDPSQRGAGALSTRYEHENSHNIYITKSTTERISYEHDIIILFPANPYSSGDLGCSHPQAEALRLQGCKRHYAPRRFKSVDVSRASSTLHLYILERISIPV